MSSLDALAIIATLLAAIAVLPGTLGILMLTNRIAASAAGARFIYFQSGALLAVALLLISYVAYRSFQADAFSGLGIGSMVTVALLLVYGFLMHAKLLFKPVTKPKYASLDEAIEKFGADEEVIGVIDRDGNPYAYIARLARRPHIVFQPEGDAPFIMSHCILAHSSMSYAIDGSFSNPDITITAALANNMVFYEKRSRCSVVQIHNRLEGTNDPLSTVSTIMTSLGSWKKHYSQSPVWVRPISWRDTFYLKLLARAQVIDPASPIIVYPLQHERDRRLPMKSCVIGVVEGDQARAYPVTIVTRRKILNDQLGGRSLGIFCDGDFMQLYDRRIDRDTVLSFKWSEQANRFVDNESGSEWSVTGACVGGKYQGRELNSVAHFNKIFWYVWADYFPNSGVFESSEDDDVSA
jgi:hypothetical protein